MSWLDEIPWVNVKDRLPTGKSRYLLEFKENFIELALFSSKHQQFYLYDADGVMIEMDEIWRWISLAPELESSN